MTVALHTIQNIAHEVEIRYLSVQTQSMITELYNHYYVTHVKDFVTLTAREITKLLQDVPLV
jgi:hypothetical protein